MDKTSWYHHLSESVVSSVIERNTFLDFAPWAWHTEQPKLFMTQVTLITPKAINALTLEEVLELP